MATSTAATPTAPAPTTPAAVSEGATPAQPEITSGTPAATPAAPESYTVKGKSYTVAELEAALSTHSTVDQAMKALAQKEASLKTSEEVWKDKGKIRKMLKERGVSEAELAEEILLEEISQAEMTPEQKELAALKAEKAEREAQAEEAKKAEQTKAQEAQVARIQEALQGEFVDAMTAAGIPKTPETVIHMTQVMLDALDAGFELKPAEAATLVRAKTFEANRPVFEGMSAAQLRDALGPKVVEAIVKDYTAGLQTQTAKAPDGVAARRSAPQKTAKPVSLDDIISQKLAAPRKR